MVLKDCKFTMNTNKKCAENYLKSFEKKKEALHHAFKQAEKEQEESK